MLDKCIFELDLRNEKALRELSFIDRCLLKTLGCEKRRPSIGLSIVAGGIYPDGSTYRYELDFQSTNSRRS